MRLKNEFVRRAGSAGERVVEVGKGIVEFVKEVVGRSVVGMVGVAVVVLLAHNTDVVEEIIDGSSVTTADPDESVDAMDGINVRAGAADWLGGAKVKAGFADGTDVVMLPLLAEEVPVADAVIGRDVVGAGIASGLDTTAR